MSADNWSVCPKCNKENVKKIQDSYGKIPPEEYLKLINETKGPYEKFTLREDYSIHTREDGTFRIVYDCHCKKCGWGFEFNLEQDRLKSGSDKKH